MADVLVLPARAFFNFVRKCSCVAPIKQQGNKYTGRPWVAPCLLSASISKYRKSWRVAVVFGSLGVEKEVERLARWRQTFTWLPGGRHPQSSPGLFFLRISCAHMPTPLSSALSPECKVIHPVAPGTVCFTGCNCRLPPYARKLVRAPFPVANESHRSVSKK